MALLNPTSRILIVALLFVLLISPVMGAGEIILMGGDHGGIGHYNNDTWNSTDNGATWTLVNASSGWTKRDVYSGVRQIQNGSIVLVGGSDGFYMQDVWNSTDNGATWTLVNATSEPGAREGATIVVLPNNDLILMGGATAAGFTFNNDTYRSTDGGNVWTLLNPSSGWTERELASSVVLPDGSIVLMGGLNWLVGTTIFNDTWRSTDGGATWNQMSSGAEWTSRWGQTSVALPNGDIVLMGGFDNVAYLGDTWRSSDKGATWTLVNSSSWTSRYGHSSVAMGDGSIVLMGGYGGGDFRNDTWRSTDKGVMWTLMNASSGWTKRNFHSSVTASLFPPPHTGNAIYGIVYDNQTGLPINGATVMARNATAYSTNISFPYGMFDGIYFFENVVNSEDVTLNATKSGYALSSDYTINTALTDRQDIPLDSIYILTLNIRDIKSGALLTNITTGIDYGYGSTTTTTGVAVIGSVSPGYITANVTAPGYASNSVTYFMTGDRTETIYMTPLITTSSMVWYAPHPVRIVIVNEYGNKIQNATISANFNSSTMPYGWAASYYGINTAVVSDIFNASLNMAGITGSDGSVTFTMQQALQYNVTIYNPGPPPLTSTVYNFEAKEDLYIIHIKTIADVISNYLTYQDPLTISEPDVNHIKFNINWTTNSSVFYSVNFTVTCVGNGTVVHTNGPNLNTTAIMNFTVTNIRGEQWLMTESAYFTDNTWMNISRGVTAKGPSGVLVDLGLPSYHMYQWIAYALIFAMGSMASQRNAHMFAVLVPVWAAMIVFFGWIPGGQIVTIIGFCVAIGAFIYMRGSLRQKFGISGGYSILMSIFLWLIFFQACIGLVNGLGIFTNNYAAQMTTQYSNVDIGIYQTQFSGSTGLFSTIWTYIDLVTTAVVNALTLLGNVVIGIFMITYFLAQVYPFIPPSIWVLVQIGDWVLLTMFFFTLLARPSPGTPGTDIT